MEKASSLAAKKLYYFSDASHQDFLAHHGPSYLASDVSRSRGAPYATLNRRAGEFYATQIDPQLDYYVNMPDHLVLAKSLVKSSSVEADVWDGIDKTPIAYMPPPGYRPESSSSVGLELGGPWSFYKEFYAAHGLTAALSFVKPQTALSSGHSLWVPLLLHNDTRESHDLVLRASLPDGWTSTSKESTYHLESHSSYPAQLFLTAPATKAGAEPQELRWTLLENGKPIGEATLLVYSEYNGVPQ